MTIPPPEVSKSIVGPSKLQIRLLDCGDMTIQITQTNMALLRFVCGISSEIGRKTGSKSTSRFTKTYNHLIINVKI